LKIFYLPDLDSGILYLPEEESRHASRTLRMQQGDKLFLTDGKGRMAEAILQEHEGKRSRVKIVSFTEGYGKRSFSLHLAIAPTKNMERVEWFLEKATELGIDRVSFLICDRSERRSVNLDRCEKIIISAMKQSLKAYLPVMEEPCSFKDFIKREHAAKKFMAYCETAKEEHLNSRFEKGEELLVLIGPEGDFSQAEAALALTKGFTHVSLGKSRLRTETAALAACMIANLKNEAS
jgi:16S rRNA (uracil1498-N3)-methyltransferase